MAQREKVRECLVRDKKEKEEQETQLFSFQEERTNLIGSHDIHFPIV